MFSLIVEHSTSILINGSRVRSPLLASINLVLCWTDVTSSAISACHIIAVLVPMSLKALSCAKVTLNSVINSSFLKHEEKSANHQSYKLWTNLLYNRNKLQLIHVLTITAIQICHRMYSYFLIVISIPLSLGSQYSQGYVFP